MSKLGAIRICGYIGLICSVLLAAATGWAYSNYNSALGTIAHSLHETTQSAATVLDQIANTTRARLDVAENTVQVLRSSRKLVQDLKVATEKQSAMLPQYATSMSNAAASTYALAGSVTVVANSLSVRIPIGLERDGLIPVIVWGRPFDAATQDLKLFAQRSASLGVSLDALASSLNGEARSISKSFGESSNQTLRLIDSMEKLATSVKDEHLPQALTTISRARGSLMELDGQANRVEQMGYALLTIGLLLAAGGVALSCATLMVATELKGAKA